MTDIKGPAGIARPGALLRHFADIAPARGPVMARLPARSGLMMQAASRSADRGVRAGGGRVLPVDAAEETPVPGIAVHVGMEKLAGGYRRVTAGPAAVLTIGGVTIAAKPYLPA